MNVYICMQYLLTAVQNLNIQESQKTLMLNLSWTGGQLTALSFPYQFSLTFSSELNFVRIKWLPLEYIY